jgi:secreted protein with Ig-like and vWFA domain
VHRGNASVSFWGAVVLSIAWSVAFSIPITGQTVGDPAKAQMQEMTRRELQLNRVGADSGQPNDPKRSQAMMDQVSEDFQRILTLHNEIVRAIAADRSLSYEFISDAMGEIRKRSSRLQSSLKLQRPEATAENRVAVPGVEGLETKDELILICKQIEIFIRNPIIETPGTVDAQQLEKARRDLDSVVQLSGYIKKRADKQKH